MIESSEISMEKVSKAFTEKQYGEMSRLLHTMRGSIGVLGAKRFVDASRELELAISNNDMEAIEVNYPRVQKEIAATIAAAQVWLASH